MLKVKHNNLILIDGIIWLIAGFTLTSRAYSWSGLLSESQLIIGLFATLLFSIIKIRFIFRKLTLNNILRILSFTGTSVSIWQFHLNKDKILIVLMIFLGIGLRSVHFIPKYVLFPVYLGIGFAMFHSAFLYFKSYIKI